MGSLACLWGAGSPQVHAAEAGRWDALADTVFEYLARDNDLPNSTAPTALAEDGEGFLWVGTQNGLARWDGYHFRSYKADPTIPGSLPGQSRPPAAHRHPRPPLDRDQLRRARSL